MNTPIALTRVMNKARRRAGVDLAPTATEWLVHFDGTTLVIFREKNGTITQHRSFCVGDIAEYDSYNLSYTGTIESITDKTVTIWTGCYKDLGCRTSRAVDSEGRALKKNLTRLDLATFCWRNYNFDAEKTARENAETSMYI